MADPYTFPDSHTAAERRKASQESRRLATATVNDGSRHGRHDIAIRVGKESSSSSDLAQPSTPRQGLDRDTELASDDHTKPRTGTSKPRHQAGDHLSTSVAQSRRLEIASNGFVSRSVPIPVPKGVFDDPTAMERAPSICVWLAGFVSAAKITIDTGSSVSFMSEALCNILGRTLEPDQSVYQTIGGAIKSLGVTTVTLACIIDGGVESRNVKFHVFRGLAVNLGITWETALHLGLAPTQMPTADIPKAHLLECARTLSAWAQDHPSQARATATSQARGDSFKGKAHTVKIKVNNVSAKCLLDNCCEDSLIAEDFFDANIKARCYPGTPEAPVLHCGFKTHQPVYVTCRTYPLSISWTADGRSKSTKLEFLVTPDLIDPVSIHLDVAEERGIHHAERCLRDADGMSLVAPRNRHSSTMVSKGSKSERHIDKEDRDRKREANRVKEERRKRKEDEAKRGRYKEEKEEEEEDDEDDYYRR